MTGGAQPISPTVGVIVPTLNAGFQWQAWLNAVAAQTLVPHRKLVVDSNSTDATAALAQASGFEVLTIERNAFSHGGTRQRAALHLQDCDLLLFLTQDAVPAACDAFAQLIGAFVDPTVAVAYGRQLPHDDAGLHGSHARLFNYPPTSSTKTQADIPRLGIKTAFCSNSFAAYRRSDLLALGGFAADLIFGEDMHLAARALLEGQKIAYVAEAVVKHSHDYSMLEDFQRCFDIGVLHSREPWLLKLLGNAEGEGTRFLRSELAYIGRNAPFAVPSAVLRAGARYLGYRLGRLQKWLPLALKRSLSMSRTYWRARS